MNGGIKMPETGTLQQVRQGSVHIIGVSSGAVHPMQEKQNVIVHKNDIPAGGLRGDLLAKKSGKDFDAEWITPANAVEEDNTRPITSAAVYTEIGNINALLATI